jgi:Calcineurin-like phosphoesterase
LRLLSDDTLVVFLSDSHIGGDGGRDIFESPDDMKALFDELAAHPGPLELVLAGDFFDLLRIAGPPQQGADRASLTIERPEYREVFDALRRLARGESRTVVYMPGNHDAEVWWNPQIRAALEREGLVHEFALSYAASFASEPGRIVYCEHGNQFDSANAFHDYADPLDTPLGSHIVTDLMPRMPSGRRISELHLREVDRVFPLTLIPEWLAGRIFYDVVALSVRWLLLPLIAVYLAIEVLLRALDARGGWELDLALAVNIPLLIVFFGLFLAVLRWTAVRTIRSATARFGGAAGEHGGAADPAVSEIRAHLEAGRRPPLAGELPGTIAVFVSGHTHAPSLTGFEAGDGSRGVLVNSGCWLRQLQPVPARLGAPQVFVGRFVQTHVRVYRSADGVQVELWERPRPAPERPPLAERVAIAGRASAEPEANRSPRVSARAAVPGSERREV